MMMVGETEFFHTVSTVDEVPCQDADGPLAFYNRIYVITDSLTGNEIFLVITNVATIFL